MLKYFCDFCETEIKTHMGNKLILPYKIVPTGYISSFAKGVAEPLFLRESKEVLLCNTCFDNLAMLLCKEKLIDDSWVLEYNKESRMLF